MNKKAKKRERILDMSVFLVKVLIVPFIQCSNYKNDENNETNIKANGKQIKKSPALNVYL